MEGSNIIGFVEKPQIKDRWINAGVYYFGSEVFSYLPDSGNIEVTALPVMIKDRKGQGRYVMRSPFGDPLIPIRISRKLKVSRVKSSRLLAYEDRTHRI